MLKEFKAHHERTAETVAGFAGRLTQYGFRVLVWRRMLKIDSISPQCHQPRVEVGSIDPQHLHALAILGDFAYCGSRVLYAIIGVSPVGYWYTGLRDAHGHFNG